MHAILLTLTLAAPRPGPLPVSLVAALRLAAEQNPEAAAARAQAAVAQATVGRAVSAWLPELTASGAYDHTTAPQQLDYGQFAGLIGGLYGLTPKSPQLVPPPLELQARNSLYGTLQISQPFFSPQGLFGIQPAQLAAQAASLSADEAREQVVLGAARAYLGAQGILGLTAAAEGALEVAKRREVEAQAAISAGSDTRIALLRAQTETARAQEQLAALRASSAGAQALLAALVGEAVVPAPEVAPLPFAPHAAEAEPWLGTFAVRAARAQVAATEAGLRADRWSILPTVAGIARGSYTSNAGFYGTNTYADLIVAVSIPLYDRGVRYAALGEDKARLLAAREHLAALAAQGQATWLAASANLEAAGAELALTVSRAELARRAQGEVEQLNRNGLATNLEVFDADNQRFLAESAAAQTRAAVEVRRAELAAAEGRLVEAVR